MSVTFTSEAAPIGTGTSIDDLPDLDVQPFFDLAWHPKQWSFEKVNGEYQWLPDLTKLPYSPGVNGAIYVSQAQNDGSKLKVLSNLREVRSLGEARGYKYIPRDSPAGDFLKRLRCRTGYHHHCHYEVFQPEEGFGVLRTEDTALKVRFQRALIEHGVVKAPPDIYRKQAIKAAEGEAQRQANAPKSAAQAANLALANERLKALKASSLPGAKPATKPAAKGKDSK